jgi:hypothetical protein
MAKQLNFDRPNKEKYISELQESSLAVSWPPKQEHDSLIFMIKNAIIDLIIEEIKEIVVPQVKEMHTTISSYGIITKVTTMVNDNTTFKMEESGSIGEYYAVLSAHVFKGIEEVAPGLLGQADTCGWIFVPEQLFS